MQHTRAAGATAPTQVASTARTDLEETASGFGMLSDEQEEWARGAFEYREEQLQKFNGKKETMAEASLAMFDERIRFAWEVHQGNAWYLHEGDPHRFEEELLNPEIAFGTKPEN